MHPGWMLFAGIHPSRMHPFFFKRGCPGGSPASPLSVARRAAPYLRSGRPVPTPTGAQSRLRFAVRGPEKWPSLRPGGRHHADLGHHPRVLVTQDVTVVDEVSEDGEWDADHHAGGDAGPLLPRGDRPVTTGASARKR